MNNFTINRKIWKALLFGGSVALAFPPFFIMPIFFSAYAWLYSNIHKSTTKEAFINSFIFFTSFFVALLYWLVNPLTFDLQHHAILIPFAFLIAPMFLGMQFAMFVWIARKTLWNNLLSRILSFSLGQLAITCFCGEIFPNFPWMLPAYVWCGHEVFMQTISVYGIYGLSFVSLLLASLCGEAVILYRKKNKYIFLLISLVCCIFATIVMFGCYRLNKNPTKFTDKTALIVQCDISQKEKLNKGLSYKILQKHISQSMHRNDVDFVIWAEAAVPYLYRENFEDLHNWLIKPLHENEFLITGVVRRDLVNSLVYNSIVVIDAKKQNVATYDKSKLVPFGEYIPFRKILSLSPLASDIEDFAVGTTSNIFKIKGLNILFANCYEVAFRHKRKNADVMINLTNDGWFGHTTELYQHLNMAKVRAVELGIPVIRVTNFGVSAVFDPCGRCIAKIPVDQAQTLEIKIPKKIE